MMTSSKQFFNALTRERHTTEKRLSIDITAMKQAYRTFKSETVDIKAGEISPSDLLSKFGCNGV